MIKLYFDDSGSSVKVLLRKLDSTDAEIPVYNGRGFTESVNIGFCSDSRMHGKIFNIDATLEKTNQFLGHYLVKSPTEMLEMLNAKKLYNDIAYGIKYRSEAIDSDLFLIPSKIVVSQDGLQNTFTILAKEDATMRFRSYNS